MIRKLKIFALLATIALWSINCSSGGGTPPPEDSTFEFVCQNGTPTAGTTSVQGMRSCQACNEPDYTLSGTDCQATPPDITFNYVCPNGTPTDGTTALEGTLSCQACNEPGFSLSGTDCNPVAAAAFSFVCENGVAAAGTDPMEDTPSCQSCNRNYALMGTTCIVELDGTFRRIGASGIAGIITNGLASIGNTLYMTGSETENGIKTELLYTVDIDTGVATQVGSLSLGRGTPTSIGPTDLASIDTTLYMVGNAEDRLYRVNTTSGGVTRVGTGTVRRFGVAANESSPQGLASIGTTLYMVGQGNQVLYTLNTSTGVAEQVGSAGPDDPPFGVNERSPRGLASIGTTLYMVGDVGKSMYTVDTTTGEAEQVGLASYFGTGNPNIRPQGLASITDSSSGTPISTLYMVDDLGMVYAAP